MLAKSRLYVVVAVCEHPFQSNMSLPIYIYIHIFMCVSHYLHYSPESKANELRPTTWMVVEQWIGGLELWCGRQCVLLLLFQQPAHGQYTNIHAVAGEGGMTGVDDSGMKICIYIYVVCEKNAKLLSICWYLPVICDVLDIWLKVICTT